MRALGVEIGRKPSGAALQVRPFGEGDISQVADLHRRVFRTGDPSDGMRREYATYFREILLRHPWYDEDLPSLVCQDADGAVVGFLGVMPRRMSFRGRPIRAAISSQFIVEPDRRSTLAALRLMSAFLSGPQDLSLADEASDATRRLWDRAGGATATLYSLYWGRLLRPGRFTLSRSGTRRSLTAPLAAAARPLCRLLDGLAARMPGSPFRRTPPEAPGEELDAATLRAFLGEFACGRSIWPAYDGPSLQWLLDVLDRKREHGRFRKVAVRNAAGDPIGWYLCYVKRDGVGEVLQFGARQDSFHAVLDHLSYHAWREGAVALSGRLEPTFLPEFRDGSCFLHHRGLWVLVHARDPEILEAVHRGDALLTRLEGEWPLRFR